MKIRFIVCFLIIVTALTYLTSILLNPSTAFATGYSYSRSITIDHTKVPNTNLSNFPVLFSSTISSLRTTGNGGNVTNSNGYDVIFSSDPACISPLNFEVEKYASTTGELEAWIKVPTLSHSTDTVIYVCYGNSSITTDQSNKTAVWDSSFKAVYHLPDGITLSANDSTSNANNCSPVNSPAATTSGQIAGAASFVAVSGTGTPYESCGTGSSLSNFGTTTSTWSFWMKPTGGDFMIMGKNDSNTVGAGWWINNLNSNPSTGSKGLRLNIERTSTNMRVGAASPSNNVWTYVTIVYDGSNTASNQKIYYNGTLQTLTTTINAVGSTVNDTPQTMYIGRFFGAASPSSDTGVTSTGMNGVLDEIEISNTNRSSDWINTQYNNQSLPDKTGGAGGFYTVGTEGAPSTTAPGAPTIGTATSGDAQATVTFTAPASNGGSAITSYTVTSSPGNITATGTSSPITVTGLTNSTVYTFTVTATNAVGTSSASSASNSVTPVHTATAPGAPTSVSASVGNTQSVVTFTAPASDGGSAITSYTITSSPGNITKTGTSSPLTVTGLTNGTAYTFTVTATNAVGTSSASSASNSVTPATTPGAPTIGTATAGDAQASVAFTAPGSNGGSAITSYTVTSSPGNITRTGTSSPITVTGLTNSTSYTFTVTATNAVGTSSASSASNSVRPVSASATVPGAPTISSVLAGNAKALVIFTAPGSNGGDTITSYTVTSTPGGFTATGSTTALYVTGLTNGTAYTFRVTATNSVGTSSPSSASSSATPFVVTPLNYPVVHVIEENRSLEDVGLPGSSLMPYLSGLISSGGALTGNYYANTHPSIPNYHWMLTGGSNGVTTNDCTNTIYNDNIFRHLISQGITFRFYIESLGSNTGADWVDCTAGVRATNANWGWGGEYSDIRNQTTAEKNAEFVNISQLATDLANHTLPQMVFIAPNLENDQHPPATIVAADTWLQNNIAGLVASSYFQTGGTGLLMVNWDEGNWDSGNPSFTDASCNATTTTGCGGHQATVLYGPRVIKGMTDNTYYQHQSMLRTLMEALGFSSDFPQAAATAPSMSPMFISGSVLTPDTIAPTVNIVLSDSDGIVKAGDSLTITANFSEPILDTPVVKIAISGANSVSATNMTKASTTSYTYTYTVGAGDGTSTLALSVGMDASSNIVTSAPTSGATYVVDNTAPTNQNTVFATSTSNIGGAAITIVSSGDATNNVWFAPSGTTNFVASATTTKAVTGTSTTIAAPATNGVYKLYIVDTAGNISSASTASLTVVNASVADAPTIGTATAGNAQATVAFTAPVFNGFSAITSYRVTSSPGNISVSSSTSPIIVTGLTNGTSYTFTVVAVNGIGTSASSSASNSVTPITVAGAPTIGTATAGNGQASVTFTAPVSNGGSAITSYTVTSNTGGFTASSSSSPILVTGLTNGTSYTFTVTATNAAGTSTSSSASNSVTPATISGVPTIGTATAGNGQASVTFTAPVSNGGSAITSYTVTSNPGGFTSTGSASPLVVTGLTNGTSYTFTVTATNAVGTSSASSASNSISPVAVPGSPTIGTATAGNGQAIVTFTAPGSSGGSAITSYTVTSSPGNIVATGTSSPITIGGLSNGTSYTFTVTATNAAGTSSASSASNSVTPVTVPGAPTSVSALVGTGPSGDAQATITFSAPVSNGGSTITGYTVTSTPGNVTANGTSSPILITGLTNGTSYTFTVTATNAVGTSTSSSASNSVTPGSFPGAPTIGTATAGNGQASVTFTAPVSNGGYPITSYRVTSSSGNISASSSTSPILVTGLTNGTAYTFTVVAINTAGTSASSSASNSVTPVTVPGTPTIGIATAGDAQASVTFTAPVSNGGSAITSYTVTSNPGGFTSTGSASPLVVTGLTNGTSYTFTVTATNAVGTSSASSASNSITPSVSVSPTASITYSDTDGVVKAGDTLTITANFNKPLLDTPVVKIAISGANTVSATDMTKASTTTYTYTHVVGSGDGTATISLSVGTDSSGNVVTSTPTSGSTFTVENTVPSISGIASSTTQTTASITWTTDDLSNSIVSYGTSSGVYSNSSSSASFVSSHSINLSGLATSTQYFYVVTSSDVAGNISTSTEQIFKTTSVIPIISSVQTNSITDTGAVIVWNTNLDGSSKVDYGLTNSYGLTTSITDTSPRVQSHSVSLSGLASCSTYHYRTKSIDALSNEVIGDDMTFTTTGCTSGASVSTSTDSTITTSGGGSIVIQSTTLTIPASFISTSSSVVFQAKELDPVSFFAGVGAPTGVSSIGSQVVSLTAYSDPTTRITTFDIPLTLTLTYSPSDVTGIDESSLKIYRYDVGTGWTALTSCSVDTNLHTVTCQTSNFSDFSLFGTHAVVVSNSTYNTGSTGGGGGGGGGPSVGMTYYNRGTTTVTAVPLVVKNKYGLIPSKFTFIRGLSLNMVGEDVKALQQFLNNNGFTIAKKGAGSKGNETTKFTSATKLQVIAFQNRYADVVLKPAGLKVSSGKVGTLTINFINSLRETTDTAVSKTSTSTQSILPVAPVKVIPKITSNLRLGNEGEDVKTLQRFFASIPGIYPSGEINGIFNLNTQKAVKKFQVKYKLSSASKKSYGVVGPATRSLINSMLKKQNQ